MNEQELKQLEEYLRALSALEQSASDAIARGRFTGTGRMTVKGYTGLHQKVSQLLPDDFYVNEALALELDDDLTEEAMVTQVQYAARQMVLYLQGLLREVRRSTGEAWDFSDLRSLGKQIQEQVMDISRNTLRRALSGIDIDIDMEAGASGVDLRG
ncbi:MAG: hypothetical protein ACOCXZ_01175, partial [Chloroflexota bacterium]